MKLLLSSGIFHARWSLINYFAIRRALETEESWRRSLSRRHYGLLPVPCFVTTLDARDFTSVWISTMLAFSTTSPVTSYQTAGSEAEVGGMLAITIKENPEAVNIIIWAFKISQIKISILYTI